MSENEVPTTSPVRAALRRASIRAAERRPVFVGSGAWTEEPIDLVAEAAAGHSADTAVVVRECRLSYSELDAAVDLAVAHLQAVGVGTGSPVLLVVENDLPSLVAI